MVSTNGHDQQRGICLRVRDVLYPRDAVALSSLNREVRGSTQALLPHSRVSRLCLSRGGAVDAAAAASAPLSGAAPRLCGSFLISL